MSSALFPIALFSLSLTCLLQAGKSEQLLLKAQAKAKQLASLPPDSELAMMAAMGLPVGFDTTQGVGVENNEKGAAHIVPKRKYRQYMNTKRPRIPGQGAPPRAPRA
mmetsp:Transcript_49971/g.125559  ORF Transcript_49971/g.125559 Transcript_49971/m.125559 type:complete len:107 (-) Transcript_49971:54-374(-)